jgi:hypothetical protein
VLVICLVQYVKLFKTFKDITSTIKINNQIISSQLSNLEKELKIQLAAKATLKLFLIFLFKNLIVIILPMLFLYCLSWMGIIEFNNVIDLLFSLEGFVALAFVLIIYGIKIKYG